MKTICASIIFIFCMVLNLNLFSVNMAPPGIIPLHVVITSKAYWDGPTKSCLPREKGGCCHIWFDGALPGPGEIVGDIVAENGKLLYMTLSRNKDIDPESWKRFFSADRFILDGEVSFEQAVLVKLGLPVNYLLPPGKYPYSIKGDMITITFK